MPVMSCSLPWVRFPRRTSLRPGHSEMLLGGEL
jgi:hypothetical protein